MLWRSLFIVVSCSGFRHDAISTNRKLEGNRIKLYSGTYSAIQEYANSTHHHHLHLINDIGIFLLGSMNNAVDLGYPVPDNNEYTDYYDRSRVARLTWASHVKHFYMVTGEGEAERLILGNESACTNLTLKFRSFTHNNKQEMYKCGPVMVLHFPHCNGDSWGPDGPCCRCQNAMKFFLDMHNYMSVQQIKSGETMSYPNWFIFSDDDYYMRVHYLQTVLENAATHPSHPYAIVAYNTQVFSTPAMNGHKAIDRVGKGMALFNSNCSVPCIHRIQWAGFGGFSIGALKQLKTSIESDELVSVCHLWSLTHDVGLGMYMWMKGLDGILIHEDNSMDKNIWHKTQMPYDELFQLLWNRITGKDDQPFNIDEYLSHEIAMGQDYVRKKRPFTKLNGIYNTLLYRRNQVRESLLHQSHILNEAIRNQIISEYEDTIDYHHKHCNEDNDLFQAWQSGYGYSLGKDGSKEYEPSVCLQYAEYIANYPITSAALGIVLTEADLDRK